MRRFDPLQDVENASAIRDEDGNWPNFHDAIVNEVHYDRGDVRPDDNVWNGAVVEVALTLAACRAPFDVRLRFCDCAEVSFAIDGPVTAPDITDLTFEFIGRGTLNDGITPLTPYIRVGFEAGAGITMTLLCFSIRAERQAGPPRRS